MNSRGIVEPTLARCQSCYDVSSCRSFEESEVTSKKHHLFVYRTDDYVARRIYLCDECARGAVK